MTLKKIFKMDSSYFLNIERNLLKNRAAKMGK